MEQHTEGAVARAAKGGLFGGTDPSWRRPSTGTSVAIGRGAPIIPVEPPTQGLKPVRLPVMGAQVPSHCGPNSLVLLTQAIVAGDRIRRAPLSQPITSPSKLSAPNPSRRQWPSEGLGGPFAHEPALASYQKAPERQPFRGFPAH